MMKKDQIGCGSGFLRRLWVVLCSQVANLYKKPQIDYKKYISQLSDEDIVSYINAGEARYKLEAIAFARETLQSRGLSEEKIARLKKQAEAHASGSELGKCEVCGEDSAGNFFKLYYGISVKAELVSLAGKNIYSSRTYSSGGYSDSYYDIAGETGAFICNNCFEREKSKQKRVPADLGTEMAIQLTRTERENIGMDCVFSPKKLSTLYKLAPSEISRLEHRCLDQAMENWAEGKGPQP